jgi:hypothetical protein
MRRRHAVPAGVAVDRPAGLDEGEDETPDEERRLAG